VTELAGAAETVVTVGSFDGVHRGHLAVLSEITRRAAVTGRQSVLVTFEPHPMEVVNPAAAPRRLTTDLERREILAETGLHRAVLLQFDEGLRTLPPEQFVRDILLARLGMRELVIGEDHGFGRGRQGDVALLHRLGVELGFTVDVVPPVVDPVVGLVSSTRIRDAVGLGQLDLAARLLGRPYRLSAVVVPGAGRGKTIGVPTANLAVPSRKLLPPDGVYAAWIEWAGGRVGGMLNQGPRPTVGETDQTVEVHLFGVDADLYAATVRVEWVQRLRDIRRFESLQALQRQMINDRARAEEILRPSPRPEGITGDD
jgi:riboflavin kinase/FMN adenylyltransferase